MTIAAIMGDDMIVIQQLTSWTYELIQVGSEVYVTL